LLLVSLAIFTLAGAASGSGFALFEQGAKATAMGGAFAATADDPSAIFYNVAGIAQQRRMAISAGATAINFQNQFTGDRNDLYTAGAHGNYKRHVFLPPNAYVIVPIGNNLTFGVGVMTPFGLRTDWQAPWIGRFVSRDANVKVVSVEPAIAWQTSDGRLALGAGAEYRRSHIILARNTPQLNPFNGRLADVASTYLSSDWASHWGWNAGVLFKVTPTWRLGASYRAPMAMKFKGTADITQISTGNPQLDALVRAGLPPSQAISTTIQFPSFLHLGVATSAIPNWDIEFDVVHTTWSRFKELRVDLLQTPQFSFSRPQDWKNANSYRLGANHVVTPDWDIRLGALYDKNPQPVQAVSALLPDADRIGLTFGVGFHRGPWVLDLTEFVLHFKKRSTEGQVPELNGTYRTDANLISANFGYRF
jgi:long-chain fatty acid transport protein